MVLFRISLNINKNIKMKSLINTILLFLVIGVAAFGQKTTIAGKVTDKSKNAIVGASAILKGTVRGVQTNTNGEYIIKGLKAGDYTILVSSIEALCSNR